MTVDPTIPEFAKPEQIAEICETMQTVENIRSRDRALIDNLANGGRPYTKEEVEKYQIQINVNWGGLNKKTQDANRQINNATLHIGQFFTATSRGGKVEKRDDYGRKFTANLHIPLKRGESGKKHFFLIRNRNASLVLHGLGPLLWMNDYGWIARNVALEDLLIPTDTWIDFSNLSHFAVNLYPTAGELFDMTHGEKTQDGWDKKAIRKIFDALRLNIPNADSRSWVENPEQMVELFKQNRCAIDSDKIPRIRLRLFLFQNKESKKWYRRILLRENVGAVNAKDGFLFKSDKPFADSLNHILHVQFGDNVLNAPLKYHSVRGIGTMLYSPEECSNRMMCQYVQHVFESLMTWFRISDPVDHARLKSIVLRQYGILEDGLSVVPQADRHQVDPGLVESVLSKFRQIMSESSSSYVQDINDGTSKERTAKEVTALVSSVNTMVSGTLQGMYLQEAFYYEEVVRRFLNKESSDEEVKEFQKSCKRDGIPDELMVPDNWIIDPEKVLGGGDRMAAQEEANALLSQAQRFDPSQQRTILRRWTVATTNDPSLGNLLVPDAPPAATDGTMAAETRFGTLMSGTPVHLVEGIDQIGYVEAMLGMLTAAVERVKQTDNMGTPQDIAGFSAVAGDIQQHIMLLSADESNNERVKQYGDHLGQLMNDVKGFAQRQQQAQEAAAAQAAQNPEAIAKAESTAMLAKLKAEIDSAKAAQKMEQSAQKEKQKAISFQLNEARKNMEFTANLSREEIQHKQDLAHKSMDHAMSLLTAANGAEKSTSE
jgi:hypothetical protein